MNGKAVYEMATTVLPRTIQGLLSRHGLSVTDVAHLIPHQPSVRVLRRTAEVLGLPIDRVRMNMSSYGNTAGATIPLLLDETVKNGLLHPGNLVAFAAVGSGWTWGAALYRWN